MAEVPETSTGRSGCPRRRIRSYCLFVDIIVVDDSVIIFVAIGTEDVEEELYEFDSLNFSVASNI